MKPIQIFLAVIACTLLLAGANAQVTNRVVVTEEMLTASSVYNGYTPITAFDGGMAQNSGWTAVGGARQAWLAVDFGEIKQIACVRVFPDRFLDTDPSYSYLDRYWVEVWANDNWVAATPTISTPTESWHPVAVNFLTSKLRFWCESDGNGPQVKEIEIYEIPLPPPVVFTNNTTIGVSDTTYEGQNIVVSNCILTVNGPHSFANLSVISQGVVTHTADPNGATGNHLELTIARDVTIDLGSAIHADGRGYGSDQGPGKGSRIVHEFASVSSGGGHGGFGGAGNYSGVPLAGGASYGSILQPATPGSGGGNASGLGGSGGGVIRLTVAGTFRVDGQIRVNGDSLSAGNGSGGAGGSIWLTVGILAGAGTIQANGGAAFASHVGGGAGGRVAVYYANSLFAGTFSVQGGAGYEKGGAGTIYTRASSEAAGLALIDNGGIAGALTPITAPEPFSLVIGGHALVYPETNLVLQSLVVATNGTLFHLASQPGLELMILQHATVDAGGAIQADGRGYGSDQGPGAGHRLVHEFASVSSGGGHGALGGAGFGYNTRVDGGSSYGSILQPLTKGSGGGNAGGLGGSGGGVIRMTVAGTLTIDGQVRANGMTTTVGNGSGGAGGSVWLTVATLAGTGRILANGGAAFASHVGGGSGGRVALYYASNLFAGNVSAEGGAGYEQGGAGTIYTQTSAQEVGQLLVWSVGTNCAMTPIKAPKAFNVTLSGPVTAYPEGPILLGNLLLANGATLTHLESQPNLNVSVVHDLTIESDAAIRADGLGYAGGPGEGATRSGDFNSAGSGASHGGYGGIGRIVEGDVAVTRGPYGFPDQPVDKGSRGGSTFSHPGPQGGGAVRLDVGSTLTLNGQISANALAPSPIDALGGGSGGSVWLTCGTFAGTGLISAKGSDGVVIDSERDAGGGGAGGRIAIYADSITFTGSTNVYGGSGYSPGASGTIHSVPASAAPAPVPVSVSPSGDITRPLDSVEIAFNLALDPATVSAADFLVQLPSGETISTSQIDVKLLEVGYVYRLSFPPQIQAGSYLVSVGPNLASLQGVGMTAVFQTNLNVVWPVISGRIQTEAGTALPGVFILAGSGPGVLSDSHGDYSLAVPPGWTGIVRALANNSHFFPDYRAYANLVNPTNGQNFTDYGPCAVPMADYQFQNTLDSSTAGAPSLSPIDSGSYFTNYITETVTRTALRFPAGAGLSLDPASMFGPSNAYTIVILFEFDTVSGWGRILNFKDATSENGVYVRNGTLQFVGLTSYSGVCITNKTWHQVVLTRNTTNGVAVYADGVVKLTASDPGGEAVINNGNILRFFKDNTTEDFPGLVSRIRIYPCALSSAAVAALDRWAVEPLAYTLSHPAPDGAGGFRFTITGPEGLAPTILRSIDLQTWNVWKNLTSFPGSLVITSTPAMSPEFFKARWP